MASNDEPQGLAPEWKVMSFSCYLAVGGQPVQDLSIFDPVSPPPAERLTESALGQGPGNFYKGDNHEP